MFLMIQERRAYLHPLFSARHLPCPMKPTTPVSWAQTLHYQTLCLHLQKTRPCFTITVQQWMLIIQATIQHMKVGDYTRGITTPAMPMLMPIQIGQMAVHIQV